jgi:hypothetical protein
LAPKDGTILRIEASTLNELNHEKLLSFAGKNHEREQRFEDFLAERIVRMGIRRFTV